ncbi:MAG: hypothetical protein U0Q19_23240 [Kineosporiaceae bacterium]
MDWKKAFVTMVSTLAIAMGSSIWGALFSSDRVSAGATKLRQERWFWIASAMLVVGALFGIVATVAFPTSR